MSHPDEGVLQAYLDGELDAAEVAQLRSHLESCDACRAALQEQREFFNEASTLVDRLVLDPPVRIPVARRRSWWKSPAVGIAASLALALSTAVLLWRPSSLSRDSDPLAPAQLQSRELAKDEADAAAPAPATIPAPAAPEKRKDTFRLRSGTGTATTSTVERKEMPAALAVPAEELPRDEVASKQQVEAEVPVQGRREALHEAPAAAGAMAAADTRVPRALGIEGQAAQAIVTSGDTLRTAYLIGGTTVVLEQRRPGATQDSPAARAMAAPKARGPARAQGPAESPGSVQVYRWKLGEEELVLRGALPVDSLAALAKLVR